MSGPAQELADAARTAVIRAGEDIGAATPLVRAAVEAALNEEAAGIASATQFSYGVWRAVLKRIDGHPHRDALLAVLRDAAAKTDANPLRLALVLIGTGEDGDDGVIGAYRGVLPA
jgi:hypothetical protein